MKLKLLSKKIAIENIQTFLFQPDENFNWKAGQYLRYKIENPQADERGESHYFTIASAPFEKYIQLSTRIVEDGSTFKKDLQKLNPGDEITATGPLGNFVIEKPELHYVFIVGGIGITPVRSIVLDLSQRNLPINITLLYANKTDNPPFKKELEEITEKHPEFKIHYFIGDNKLDGNSLQPLTSNNQSLIFYISGPEPMMQSFEKILKDLGVPEEHIKHDYFPGYKEI